MMRKRGALKTCNEDNGHLQVLPRPKKVTLWSRTLVEKGAADACPELGVEVFGNQRTAYCDPNRRCETAFPLDRNQRLVRARMDRDVHFPLIPRYASLLWFTDRGFLMPGRPDPSWAAMFQKNTNDPIK